LRCVTGGTAVFQGLHDAMYLVSAYGKHI
jgi:hypothetical protein